MVGRPSYPSRCRRTRACRGGVPQYEEAPIGFGSLLSENVTLTGGPAPVRAHIEESLPDVPQDRTVDLAGVPDGYRAMGTREALEVFVRP